MDALKLLTRGTSLKLSAGNATVPTRPSSTVELSTPQKRKRDEFETDSNGTQPLTEEGIRQFQRSYNFKISDLAKLHSSHGHDTKKARKDQARVYPQPLQSFQGLSSYNVNFSLRSNLKAERYQDPTEVQMAALPLLLRDHADQPDLLTVAPTGSGKTLAFLIPLIDKLSKLNHTSSADRTVRAVILAPTKELVTQTVHEGRKLAAKTGVRLTAFKKGMRLFPHVEASRISNAETSLSEIDEEDHDATLVKSDILVSTPLTFLHAIQPEGTGDPHPLPHINDFVLDEADVLLDDLFRDQTITILSALTSPNLRISLWSATIGASIESCALSTITTRRATLKISKPAPILRIVIGLKDTSLPNISHRLLYTANERGKLTGLRNLLHPPPQTPATAQQPSLHPPFLIFTQTIPRAQALHAELRHDVSPSRIAVLHAGLSSTQRHAIMTSFRQAKLWILITTDLLSRGVDFKGMNGVVNYDIPTTVASYIHRAGRTGRQGRQGGVVVTFWTDGDVQYLRPIATVIRNSEKAADSADADKESAVPKWLINALPEVGKKTRRDLKDRGVEVRRGVKLSDDKDEKRAKKKNAIGAGTGGGFEKRARDRRKGMIEGSKRRKEKEGQALLTELEADEEFSGFD